MRFNGLIWKSSDLAKAPMKRLDGLFIMSKSVNSGISSYNCGGSNYLGTSLAGTVICDICFRNCEFTLFCERSLSLVISVCF